MSTEDTTPPAANFDHREAAIGHLGIAGELVQDPPHTSEGDAIFDDPKYLALLDTRIAAAQTHATLYVGQQIEGIREDAKDLIVALAPAVERTAKVFTIGLTTLRREMELAADQIRTSARDAGAAIENAADRIANRHG